jgi:2,5-furandicarboxylate decarboxylase 1
MGYDATVPLSAPTMRFKRIQVPGQQEVELDTVAHAAPQDWQRVLQMHD